MTAGFVLRRAVGHTLVARVDGERVLALYAIREAATASVGQMYVGRVVRVVDSLSAAFVAIGEARPAFVPLSSVPPRADGRQGLFAGEKVVVQIERAASETKGAKATMRLIVPSTLCVLVAGGEGVSVSQKVVDGSTRQTLEQAVLPVVQRAEAEQGSIGIIVRTAAAEAPHEALVAAAERLWLRYRGLLAAAEESRKPGRLADGLPAVAHFLAQAHRTGDAWLWTDDGPGGEDIVAGLGSLESPAAALRLASLTDWLPDGGKRQLAGACAKANSGTVHLPCGGSIVFGQTEALWAIDVNSGEGSVLRSGARKKAQSALALVNLQAAEAAGEQIVLRNLGGIIVIDFIDIDDAAHRREVVARLEGALALGRTKFYVSKMSELGLVQLTRQQRHGTWPSLTTSPCPRCETQASEPAAWYVASELLRAAEGHAKGARSPLWLLQCAPEVAEALFGEGRGLLASLEATLGCELVPVARAHLPRRRFELLPTGDDAGLVYAESI